MNQMQAQAYIYMYIRRNCRNESRPLRAPTQPTSRQKTNKQTNAVSTQFPSCNHFYVYFAYTLSLTAFKSALHPNAICPKKLGFFFTNTSSNGAQNDVT